MCLLFSVVVKHIASHRSASTSFGTSALTYWCSQFLCMYNINDIFSLFFSRRFYFRPQRGRGAEPAQDDGASSRGVQVLHKSSEWSNNLNRMQQAAASFFSPRSRDVLAAVVRILLSILRVPFPPSVWGLSGGTVQIHLAFSRGPSGCFGWVCVHMKYHRSCLFFFYVPTAAV